MLNSHGMYSFAFSKDNRPALSGIMMFEGGNDTIRAAVVNEFGVTALAIEYVASRRKMKICNIIKPLDRWYMRRTLSSDLRALLAASVPEDSIVTYRNDRHNLVYSLAPMRQ